MTDEKSIPAASRKPFPTLRYHKSTHRFFIDWQGRWSYWPSGTSRAVAQADHDAMRATYESTGRIEFPASETRTARTVDVLIAAYLAHCDAYYVHSPATVGNIERALAPLHERFGKRPVDSFGPRTLREVRETMIETGWSRKLINARVQCIVRMFKWAVAEELVVSTIYEALRAVEGLRLGRTTAPEGPGRRPVPWEHVEPVLPHVSREVAAMLVIQAESGARPGEVVQMRVSDLDRSGKVWTYKPRRHKTQYLGKTRLVPLFAPAQRALEPFLHRVPPLDPDEPIFSPRRAEEERSVERRRARKTRVQPSQRERPAVPLAERVRSPRDGYDVNGYARAVRRGIEAANAALIREAITRGVLRLVPEQARDRVAAHLAGLPISISLLAAASDKPKLDKEEQRLRRVLARATRHVSGLESLEGKVDAAQLLAAALAAIDGLKTLVPFWSPYQLRHRFATVGEQRFGEAAVSLAMGHASLRMTEHYIERNLKAVFERMAEQA